QAAPPASENGMGRMECIFLLPYILRKAEVVCKWNPFAQLRCKRSVAIGWIRQITPAFLK
ncbi:TPA: hypothetical protein DCG61_01235, partial [Patescibacteria group bacterium]|nr:hypothetical protein [Patescibacteria group bacterium]